MPRRKHHHHDPEQRRGYFGGVYGATYALSGGYLNPAQFGYSTAQSPTGDLTTTAAAAPAAAATAAGGASA